MKHLLITKIAEALLQLQTFLRNSNFALVTDMQSTFSCLICLLRSEVGHIHESQIPALYPSVAEQSL